MPSALLSSVTSSLAMLKTNHPDPHASKMIHGSAGGRGQGNRSSGQDRRKHVSRSFQGVVDGLARGQSGNRGNQRDLDQYENITGQTNGKEPKNTDV